MELAAAQIDAETGQAICPGHVTILNGLAAPLPEHSWLLVDFRENLEVRLVSAPEKDNDGFCSVSTLGPRLAFSNLRLADLSMTGSVDPAGHTLVRTGPSKLVWPTGPNDPNRTIHFDRFTLHTRYDEQGLRLSLVLSDGKLSAPGSHAGPTSWPGDQVRVETVISWENLTVKGFLAAPHWKFGHKGALPSKEEKADRARAPHRLDDLLISQGLAWPLLPGFMRFSAGQNARELVLDSRFLYAFLEGDVLKFSDAPRAVVLDNGFAYAHGSNAWVVIELIRRDILEKAFATKDHFALDAAGGGLGQVRYRTGYAQEPGDPFGQISQAIEQLRFTAELTTDGLEMHANAQLGDFDAETIKQHRKERNSKLDPRASLSLQTIAPWALLKVRDFAFAARAVAFR